MNRIILEHTIVPIVKWNLYTHTEEMLEAEGLYVMQFTYTAPANVPGPHRLSVHTKDFRLTVERPSRAMLRAAAQKEYSRALQQHMSLSLPRPDGEPLVQTPDVDSLERIAPNAATLTMLMQKYHSVTMAQRKLANICVGYLGNLAVPVVTLRRESAVSWTTETMLGNTVKRGDHSKSLKSAQANAERGVARWLNDSCVVSSELTPVEDNDL